MPGAVTIYHNPGCGNSRGALQLIRAAGIEPVIIVPEDPARARHAGRAAEEDGAHPAAAHARQGAGVCRAWARRATLVRRPADRSDAGAPDPHQPSRGGHRARRAALPPARDGARDPAGLVAPRPYLAVFDGIEQGPRWSCAPGLHHFPSPAATPLDARDGLSFAHVPFVTLRIQTCGTSGFSRCSLPARRSAAVVSPATVTSPRPNTGPIPSTARSTCPPACTPARSEPSTARSTSMTTPRSARPAPSTARSRWARTPPPAR